MSSLLPFMNRLLHMLQRYFAEFPKNNSFIILNSSFCLPVSVLLRLSYLYKLLFLKIILFWFISTPSSSLFRLYLGSDSLTLYLISFSLKHFSFRSILIFSYFFVTHTRILSSILHFLRNLSHYRMFCYLS